MRIFNLIEKYATSLTVAVIVGATLFASIANAGSSFTAINFFKYVSGYILPTSSAYSVGTQLQSPVASSTFAAGSLSGGRLVVEVAALSYTGTSSPSNEIATTTIVNQGLQLTWPTIPNATGYAVYVGTSTSGSEQSYFLATSTAGAVNTYYTLLSTSSPTYYSIPNNGAGYLAQMGAGTSTLSVSGTITATASATTTVCSNANAGAVFYNNANAHLWLCQSGAWALIK